MCKLMLHPSHHAAASAAPTPTAATDVNSNVVVNAVKHNNVNDVSLADSELLLQPSSRAAAPSVEPLIPNFNLITPNSENSDVHNDITNMPAKVEIKIPRKFPKLIQNTPNLSPNSPNVDFWSTGTAPAVLGHPVNPQLPLNPIPNPQLSAELSTPAGSAGAALPMHQAALWQSCWPSRPLSHFSHLSLTEYPPLSSSSLSQPIPSTQQASTASQGNPGSPGETLKPKTVNPNCTQDPKSISIRYRINNIKKKSKFSRNKSYFVNQLPIFSKAVDQKSTAEIPYFKELISDYNNDSEIFKSFKELFKTASPATSAGAALPMHQGASNTLVATHSHSLPLGRPVLYHDSSATPVSSLSAALSSSLNSFPSHRTHSPNTPSPPESLPLSPSSSAASLTSDSDSESSPPPADPSCTAAPAATFVSLSPAVLLTFPVQPASTQHTTHVLPAHNNTQHLQVRLHTTHQNTQVTLTTQPLEFSHMTSNPISACAGC